MAERRMFAKTIVLSDDFLDMPPTARCLYFTLGMFADDDGFVNSPKGIMRQCGATDDDLKILLAKKFLISFESGVIVIKHWRINNYLQRDRYKETVYTKERELLDVDERGNYHKKGSMYTQDVYTQDVYTDTVYTQDSIGKDSIGKDSIGKDSIGKDSVGDESPKPPSGGSAAKKSFDLESLLGEYTWTDSMKDTVRDWFTYKKERREAYKEQGAKSQLKIVDRYISEYGEPPVKDQILNAMGSGYRGMILDRLDQKPKQKTMTGHQENIDKWRAVLDELAGNNEIIDADGFDVSELEPEGPEGSGTDLA